MRTSLNFGAMAIGLLAFMLPTSAFAAACTEYERDVYQLAQEAQNFQKTEKFKELGFSVRGQQKWLHRVQAARDNPLGQEFIYKHGFAPMDIYSVASEYMNAGHLDDGWRSTERLIKKLRCK